MSSSRDAIRRLKEAEATEQKLRADKKRHQKEQRRKQFEREEARHIELTTEINRVIPKILAKLERDGWPNGEFIARPLTGRRFVSKVGKCYTDPIDTINCDGSCEYGYHNYSHILYIDPRGRLYAQAVTADYDGERYPNGNPRRWRLNELSVELLELTLNTLTAAS